MQKMRRFWFALFIVSSLLVAGCAQGESEEVFELSAPIHMEVPTDDLQPRMGLSGFIFGSFLMLSSYLIIIVSCILLIVRDEKVQKLVELYKMAGSMLGTGKTGSGGSGPRWLIRVTDADFRVRMGTLGLLGGVLLAYLGAWIAM